MASPLPTRLGSDRLTRGTVVDGKYEVVDTIGSGGFALVYRARQLNIERPVAIKLLNAFSHPDEQESYTARFLQEAKVAAQIRHPNVVSIYDFGVFHGRPFIVMELLEGYDLKHALKHHGPFEPERIRRLMCDTLDALGKGHDKGIVHKDLKPGNLFIHDPEQRNEALRVLDFGIARVQHSTALTQSQQVLGTPRYYAPEYVQKRIVLPALDVYQIGLILVEAMMGEPLVGINDPFLCMMHHCSGQLPVPVRLLESPLGPILVEALATEHFKRYKDAHIFRDALETIDLSALSKLGPNEPRCYVRDVKISGGRVIVPRDAIVSVAQLRKQNLTGPQPVGAVLANHTNDTVITPGAQRALGATVHLPSGEFDPLAHGVPGQSSPTLVTDVSDDIFSKREGGYAPMVASPSDNPTQSLNADELDFAPSRTPAIAVGIVVALILIGGAVTGAVMALGDEEAPSAEGDNAVEEPKPDEGVGVGELPDFEMDQGGGTDDEAHRDPTLEAEVDKGEDVVVDDDDPDGAEDGASEEGDEGGGGEVAQEEAPVKKVETPKVAVPPRPSGEGNTKRRRRRRGGAIPLLPTLNK